VHERRARGLKADRAAAVVVAGHALVQRCRGHYELGLDAPVTTRIALAFSELALTLSPRRAKQLHPTFDPTTQQRL
jgi:hypothetical protein